MMCMFGKKSDNSSYYLNLANSLESFARIDKNTVEIKREKITMYENMVSSRDELIRELDDADTIKIVYSEIDLIKEVIFGLENDISALEMNIESMEDIVFTLRSINS